MLGGFGYRFQSSFISTGSLIQFLLDVLHPLFCFGGRAEDKIQRQKTGAIRPPQGQHLKTLQACAAVMVENPGQKFNNLGTGSIIGTVIKNQDFLSRITGEQGEIVGNLDNYSQHELSPVVPGIFQQLIGCILLERQIAIGDYSPVKIVALKRQHEDNGEQCQRRYSSQFPYAAFIEQGADLVVSKERRDSTLQPFCFLSLLMFSSNIHIDPSFLILLMFSQKPIYQEAKGFSAIIALFQIHICLFGGIVHKSES
jgi:hypothetical protein